MRLLSEIIKIASNVLGISIAEAEKNAKEIPEIEAYYFWNPVRGGLAVIVNREGEKLAATSSVSYETHLQAFIDGRRN